MFWLGACAPKLSKDLPKSESYAFQPSREGILAQVAGNISVKFGKDKSGFLAVPKNDEALKWRLALVDHAQHSIDAQYFIWQGDEAGVLLAMRLLRAAERGVRVRLLIDDIKLPGKARAIPILDSHPNFEIRVFNPWEKRGGYLGGGFEFLGRMKHLNHRMHNKLFVVDNHFAIVGGRNIGNEYFGLSKKKIGAILTCSVWVLSLKKFQSPSTYTGTVNGRTRGRVMDWANPWKENSKS
jgi:putative cardiolipin synthase